MRDTRAGDADEGAAPEVLPEPQEVGIGLRVLQGAADRVVVQGIDGLVRIQHQDPVAGAAGQAGVPRGGEVVHPGEVSHGGPEALGDLPGPVRGARVQDHHLVDEVPDRVQAVGQGAWPRS